MSPRSGKIYQRLLLHQVKRRTPIFSQLLSPQVWMHEPRPRAIAPTAASSYGELKNAWRNFQDFRLDGHFCDVTLRTDTENGRLFRAHRAVLCRGSKSTIFLAYFKVFLVDPSKPVCSIKLFPRIIPRLLAQYRQKCHCSAGHYRRNAGYIVR